MAWCALLAASLTGADFSHLRPGQGAWLAAVPLGLAAVAGAALAQSFAPVGVLPAHPVWRQASDLLGIELPARPFPTAEPPWQSLGPPLLFTLAFVRAYFVAADERGAERLVRVLAWSGLAYAVYAIGAAVLAPGTVLWWTKEAYRGNLTGTFINRNTAAVFFGSLAVLWLLLGLRAVRRSTGDGLSLRLTLALWSHKGVPRDLVRAAAGLIACLAATAMTASRAGLVLTMVALVTAALLWFGRPGGRPGVRKRPVLGAVALVLVLGALWGGAVGSRIDERGLTDVNRFETYAAVASMISQAPWLGIGLGQFEAVFPAYRAGTGVTQGIWDRAHSVPLEFAVEIGLPATAIVLLAWAAVAVGLALGCARRRRARLFPIAGLCVGLIGSLHAVIDFSLQIPGYAVPFAAVVAAGLAQSTPRKQAGPVLESTDEPAGDGRADPAF